MMRPPDSEPPLHAARPFAFPRSRRILLRADFIRVQKESRTAQDRVLRICFRSDPERANEPARLGLAVSRRVGNSPTRNRVKRWIREWFRTHPGIWPNGLLVLVIPKPLPEGHSRHAIEGSLEGLSPRVKRPRQES